MKILRTLFKNFYVEGDFKIRDDCQITGKYRFTTNLQLNHKIPLYSTT